MRAEATRGRICKGRPAGAIRDPGHTNTATQNRTNRQRKMESNDERGKPTQLGPNPLNPNSRPVESGGVVPSPPCFHTPLKFPLCAESSCHWFRLPSLHPFRTSFSLARSFIPTSLPRQSPPASLAVGTFWGPMHAGAAPSARSLRRIRPCLCRACGRGGGGT